MDAILVIILFMILIFALWNIQLSVPELNYLKPTINQILQNSGFSNVEYRIYPSKLHSFTKNKKDIYLHTGDFNHDTILFVALHEIAHILCNDEQHTELFYSVEKQLHQKAIQLGYLDVNHIDPNYPCI